MAKGKLSLLDTTDKNDIIFTDEEVGSVPNFMLDEEYGISGCYADMAVVVKKKANKTGKEENGENPNKVYSFHRWDELKYDSRYTGIFEIYAKIRSLVGLKKLKKSTDIRDLIKIQEEIKADIHKVLDINTLDNQVIQVCDLMDTIQYLKKQITEGKTVLAELNQACRDTTAQLKEARTIIVETMPKQKKFKSIKEEE